MSMRLTTVSVLLLAAAVSCRPDDRRTDTFDPQEAMQHREDLPADVLAQLDSGSAAFREDDHEGALAHYTKATELGPEIAAAWFGVYMAQHALGNMEAATAALEKAQSVNPGSTLLRSTNPDTAR
ncbi:MAG TPA: tetratricopeptide repeat protein [Longimicrobiales bacterium]|nr:tetratricopeptide repeat protein [Longimicrobiales bacterium]